MLGGEKKSMRESVGTRFDPELQMPVFETDADVVLRSAIPRAEVDVELVGERVDGVGI